MPNERRHGGKRPGAGRRRGSGPHQEPTQPIRVPLSWIPSLKGLLANRAQTRFHAVQAPWVDKIYWPTDAESLPLILYVTRVAAGFPSPADDYVEGQLDLNSHLAIFAQPLEKVKIR